MKLVYDETGLPVQAGDLVEINDQTHEVIYFREPHSPSSSGKVTVRRDANDMRREYYVSIIGAKWIEREDQGWVDPDYDPTPYCAWCHAMDVKDCDCGPIAENH